MDPEGSGLLSVFCNREVSFLARGDAVSSARLSMKRADTLVARYVMLLNDPSLLEETTRGQPFQNMSKLAVCPRNTHVSSCYRWRNKTRFRRRFPSVLYFLWF